MNLTNMLAKASSNIAAKVGPRVAPIAAKVSDKSPVILCVVGGACVVGGTVLACRATLKAKDLLDAGMTEAEKMKMTLDNYDMSPEEAEDLCIAIRKTHLDTGIKLARSYILPTCLVISGIMCFVVARNIEHRRLLGTIAALDALNLQFEDYRRNVIEDQGPAADIRYMTGDKSIKADFYEEVDGKQKKVKKEVVVRDQPADMFCFLFDDCNSTEWKRDAWRNREFFEMQEGFHYRKKYSRGHLLLNEALEDFGFAFEPWTTQWEWKITGDMDLDELPMYEIVERYTPEELESAKEEHRNPEPSFWIEFKNLTPISDHYKVDD